jgi:hypothetical protein
MAFTLDQVVPWGRSYDEYIQMFKLNDQDLKSQILGCGDGPAAFNARLTKMGGQITSCDPVYKFSTEQLKSRVSETYATIMTQLEKNKSDYIWKNFSSVENLGATRMMAMNEFFSDFDAGKDSGRYVPGELPNLPFKNNQFDIALSSHFLFLYSTHFSEDFHLQAINEMLRVAKEVRIFPLLALDGNTSPYVKPLSDLLIKNGFDVSKQKTSYEFQKNGNEMLSIKRTSILD